MSTYGELFNNGAGGTYGNYGTGPDLGCTNPTIYDTFWLRRDGTDDYHIIQDSICRTIIEADFGNAGATGEFAFCDSATAADLPDAEIVSQWDDQAGLSVRQGNVHRLQTTGGHTTCVAVVKNTGFGAIWGVNVFLIDSANPSDTGLGFFPFTGMQASLITAKPLPWYLRTRLIGTTLSFKMWPSNETEPAWGDTAYGNAIELPPGAPSTGCNGWFAGSLSATDSITYSALQVIDRSDTTVAPIVTGQHRSYTIDEILDLVNGIGQMSIGFAFEVLDNTLSYLATVHPPTPASISVRASTSSVAKRSMSGFTVSDAEAIGIDPFKHRIRGIVDIEGYRFPIGVFMFADAHYDVDSASTDLAGGLVDQTVILDQPRTRGYSIPPGDNIYDHVVELLLISKVPIYDIPDHGWATTSEPLTWKTGDHLYKILADCFALLGWYPPYFNNEGVLIGKPVPSIGEEVPDHIYWTGSQGGTGDSVAGAGAGQGRRIFDGSLTITNRLLSAPNRYVVTSTNANQPPVTGVYNVPASAPHSFTNRGYYVTKYFQVQNIATKQQARAHARQLAHVDMASYRQYKFSSNIDPRHDIFDIVMIDGDLGFESDWSITFKPEGPHTHVVQKIWSDDSGNT